ncbi:MAG: ferritin family protein [Verrucomicrobia bacterium]|nr:ferritin family protein [Verrucomicrobiota bacterium]MCG2681825.1 ferritin family protein [Kiritimatiellia bacterium]MBU4247707.1 ferritin family protein [Verrucomicrobiota bacterium]MBU4291642.1 ferritin family protein [Verrucomicrobiota bacterium]MBU4429541.1 ferritin family protein [Verrucomicrobiota bacterium]
MAIQFTAAEILEMAEQIERNGSAFYRAAAKLNPKSDRLLLTLAEQEDGHLAIFTGMRRQLDARASEPLTYDPADESTLYLKAMADRRVFNVDQDPTTLLSGNDSLEHILGIATRMEKDSIVFYTGMKPLVPPALGQAKLDAIIQEEWKHIVFLSKLSADLRSGAS